MVIGLPVIQVRVNRAGNFKSASRYALGWFEITRPITPWIVLDSPSPITITYYYYITSSEIVFSEIKNSPFFLIKFLIFLFSTILLDAVSYCQWAI